MHSEEKFDSQTPKITPLPGFIETRYVKCGRLNCHCDTSKGHGPYHYRVYRKGKRKFKQYIKADELPFVSACIEERRRLFKQAAEINRQAKLQWQWVTVKIKEIQKRQRVGQ